MCHAAGASGEGQAPTGPPTAEGGSRQKGRLGGVPHWRRAAPAVKGHAGDFAKSRPKRQVWGSLTISAPASTTAVLLCSYWG